MQRAASVMSSKISEVMGCVHSQETFTGVDGPGARHLLFLQSCWMRCKFCANPDTWRAKNAPIVSSKSVADQLAKSADFLSGVTVSGGEPLLQPEFVSAIFQEAHALGLDTCLDTSGHAPMRNMKLVLPYTDIALLCVKHLDPRMYRSLTGCNIAHMHKFTEELKRHETPFIVRYVVIPDITNSRRAIDALVEYVHKNAPTCKSVELLPYHRFGESKWTALGLRYPFHDVPTANMVHVRAVAAQLTEQGVNVSM